MTEDGHLIGTPIRFNSPTRINTPSGEFEEVIERSSVNDNLLKDVVLFVNHDKSRIPLARTRTGNLKLEIRDDGVYMDAKLNLERSDCKDVYLAVKDGTISGMSFGFRVEEDEWSEVRSKLPKRKIKKIGYVQEVSVVTDPAYESTNVYARSGESLDGDSETLDKVRAEDRQKELDNSKKQLELEKAKALALISLE